jgi:hypothetical protein
VTGAASSAGAPGSKSTKREPLTPVAHGFTSNESASASTTLSAGPMAIITEASSSSDSTSEQPRRKPLGLPDNVAPTWSNGREDTDAPLLKCVLPDLVERVSGGAVEVAQQMQRADVFEASSRFRVGAPSRLRLDRSASTGVA